MAITKKVLNGIVELKDWITSNFAFKSHGTHVSSTTCVTSINGRKGAVTISTGSSGTTNYNDLSNKPQINSVELKGNKSAADLNLALAEHGDHVSPSTCVTAITVKQKDTGGNVTTLLENAKGHVQFTFNSSGDTIINNQVGVESIKIGSMVSAKQGVVDATLDEIGAVDQPSFNTLEQSVAKHMADTTIHFQQVNPYGLFAPDFSRRIEFQNYGPISESRTTIVFKLHSPCYVFTEYKTFGKIDGDAVLEMAQTLVGCVAHCKYDSSNDERFNAAYTRDNTYIQVSLCGSQPHSVLTPIGTIGYYYHLATGAIGSNDTGDNPTYVKFYIVPACGTPIGTKLCTLYTVTYGFANFPVTGSSNTYKLARVETYAEEETIKA